MSVSTLIRHPRVLRVLFETAVAVAALYFDPLGLAAQKSRAFASLIDADKDAVIGGLESGSAKLDGVDGQAFFKLLLANTREGFFADPIYGGNRDMCAWRMIGYPGARYDYRDWVHRHNERYPHPPVSFMGRADWNAHKT